MSTISEAIAGRSSTRAYTEEKLTKGELDALITAGLQAPTATNRQELHFTVLPGDAPIIKEIETETAGGRDTGRSFYYNAPVLIIISGETAFRWTAVDAGIAVENIALAAEGLGLGSVILGCIRDAMLGARRDYFAGALGFPEGYDFQIAIAVGHKAAKKAPHTFVRDRDVTEL